LIAALIFVALGYALSLKGNFTYQDEHDYYSIASNLLHRHYFSNDGLTPTAHRPPGYPALLALILVVRDSVTIAKMSNLIWWIGAALLAGSLAKDFYGPIARSLSLLFVLLYPVALYTSGTIYPQAFAAFLFLLSIYIHFRDSHRWTTSEAAIQGILFSALILSVPLYMGNLVAFLGFVMLEPRGFRRALIIFAIVFGAISLWTIRNYETYGRFVAIATNSGENLLFGNSALSGSNTGTNVNMYLLAPEAAGNSSEIERDAIYKKHAVDWIVHNPWASAVLFLKKLLNWFNYRNQLVITSESSRFRDLVMALTYYPLLALSLLLLATRRSRLQTGERYLFVSYGIAALSYAVFFTRIRFRVPFDFLMIILAGGYLSSILANHFRAGNESRWLPSQG
jgi:hypothetical protein